MELRAGSVAIVVSDGVTAGYDDRWLIELLSSYEGESPQQLAGSVIETASQKFGMEDDMTVIAIFVSERT
jgi:stage II sporulation protein E